MDELMPCQGCQQHRLTSLSLISSARGGVHLWVSAVILCQLRCVSKVYFKAYRGYFLISRINPIKGDVFSAALGSS